MEETVETRLQHVSAIIEIAAEFAIAFGLQIIGALVILFIGLKFAAFVGRRITGMCERKEIDVTLSRYYRSRFEVNRAAYSALKGAGIELMSGGRVAVLAESPTAGA